MTVVIVSTEDDLHARAVAYELRTIDVPHAIIPSGSFPAELSLSIANDEGGIQAWIDTAQLSGTRWKVRSRIDLSESVVWWRRPNGHKPAASMHHPKISNFIYEECRQAFAGCVSGYSKFYFNDFGNTHRARNKPFQLAAARMVGLRVPNTLITNNPDEAREFISRYPGGCIFKPFTGVDFGLYETRKIDHFHLSQIDRIATAPAIIQEFIDGEFDVRVTVVGDKLFCAALLYKEAGDIVDSRMARYPILRSELPLEVERKTLELVKSMGLTYAAVDFRKSIGGEYIFFEVNPEGQYLWTEIEAEIPISKAIAELLNENLG